MAEVTEREYVVLPNNTKVMEWSTQDTINAIMDMEPCDDRDQAVLDFLEKSSHEERLRIGIMIQEHQIGHRHMIEEMVEQIIDDVHCQLNDIVEDDGAELPGLDESSLISININRLHRNLLGMNLHEMFLQEEEGRPGITEQQLLQAPLDQQETIEAAIQDTIEANSPWIEPLMRQVFWSIRNRLAERLET